MKQFHSTEEFRECYFPAEVAKERRDARIAEVGFGAVFAEETIEKIRRAMRESGAAEEPR